MMKPRDYYNKHCGFDKFTENKSFVISQTYSHYIKPFDINGMFLQDKNISRGVISICIAECPTSYFSKEESHAIYNNCSEYESKLICKYDKNKCSNGECIEKYYASVDIYKRCIPKIENLTIVQVVSFVGQEYKDVQYLVNFGLKFVENLKNVSILFFKRV